MTRIAAPSPVAPAPQSVPPTMPSAAGGSTVVRSGRSPGLAGAQPADPAKVAKAAQDFEAMAIGQLLQPMFDTVDTAHSSFGGGDGEAAWKPMLVQAIAKQIAASGGLGLARPVYDAMLRMQEKELK